MLGMRRNRSQRVATHTVCACVGVTAASAYYAAASELYLTLMQGMGRWVLLLAPFAFLMVMNFGLQRLSVTSLALIFLAFAGTMGLSLGGIFYVYSMGSLTQVFLITAGTFAIMAIAGVPIFIHARPNIILSDLLTRSALIQASFKVFAPVRSLSQQISRGQQ